MARRTGSCAAPLVSLTLLFQKSEVVALDVMAEELGLDRGRLVRSGLGVLALLGPELLRVLEAAARSGAAVSVRVDVLEPA